MLGILNRHNEPATIKEVLIIYTNDIHGHAEPFKDPKLDGDSNVGGVAYVAGEIEKIKKENPGKPVFYVDAGDTYQGSILSDRTQGKPITAFLNREKPDGVVVGNHEFDTGFGIKVLKEIAKRIRFPWLGANVIEHVTGRIYPFLLASVVKEHEGVKAGIVGITTPDRSSTPANNLVGVDLLPMGKTLKKEIKKLDKENPDLSLHLVAIHEGPDAVRPVAEKMKQPTIFIGGHTHEVIPPMEMGKSLYVQGGCYGEYVGLLHVFINTQTKEIVKFSNETIPVLDKKIKPDTKLNALVTGEAKKVEVMLSQIVGETPADLSHNDAGESLLDNLMTDALRSAGNAEIGIVNSRSSRADIPKGKIRMKNLYEVTPWDIPVAVASLKAKYLKSALEMAVSGKNFNCEHPDTLHVSGLHVVYDMSQPEGSRVREAWLDSGEQVVKNGELANRKRMYKIATRDFLLHGGRDYDGFKHAVHISHGALIRDAVAEYLKTHPVNATPQGRIEYKNLKANFRR